MKLRRLTICTPYCGDDRYIGTLEFIGRKGEITLNLNESLSQRVLDVVGDVLIETSKECAADLTAAIIDAQTPMLERPVEEK